MEICVIILTYKREELLPDAIESVVASANRTDAENNVTIFIVDNDPDSKNDYLCHVKRKNRTEIIYKKRSSNIGGRANFSRSLLDAYNIKRFDAFIFLSDDDYVFPSFINEYAKKFKNGSDSVLSSCFVMHEPSLNVGQNKSLFSFSRHTLKIVPTRPVKEDKLKLQFLLDSGLLSGVGYSKELVQRYHEMGDEIIKYVETLWYPMAFISSFGDKVSYIHKPIFVHAQENATHWGEFDAYQEFFLERIEMIRNISKIGNISKEWMDLWIDDFIGHQSYKRILKYSISEEFRLGVIVVALNKMFFETFPKLSNGLSRRLVFWAAHQRAL